VSAVKSYRTFYDAPVVERPRVGPGSSEPVHRCKDRHVVNRLQDDAVSAVGFRVVYLCNMDEFRTENASTYEPDL
jgi:hypothetical protein